MIKTPFQEFIDDLKTRTNLVMHDIRDMQESLTNVIASVEELEDAIQSQSK